MDLVNLNGRKLNVDNSRYYNLKTSRLIKNIPIGFIISDRYRVVGTFEELHQFARLNKLNIKDVLPSEYWKEELVCKYSEAYTDDIEKIPEETLHNLNEFSLMGMNLKARILDIIDGDTVSLAVFIPLLPLSQMNIGRSGRYRCSALPFQKSSGFVARLRCRLQGIDTVEKNTEKGLLIRETLIKICNQTKNIVHVQFYEPDKYGRHLVRLYSFANSKRSINEELLEHKEMTNVYHGGKKESFEEKRSLFSRIFHLRN